MTPPWLVATRQYGYTDEEGALLDLIEALGEALIEAQALLDSDEENAARVIAYTHGQFTDAFLAKCQAAHRVRLAALARYQRGPEA